MTVNPHTIDLSSFVAEHLERAEPDLLPSMLSTFVRALMSAEGRRGLRRPTVPETGTPGPARSRSRSRSCGRAPTFRTGCSSAANAERALTSVVATC
jgi:putative transposase